MENKILYTEDLSQFKTMAGNRPLNRNHISNLKESISKNPELLENRPIIVNDRKEVVDGQHRLEACRELGFGVWYTNSNNWGLREVCILNQNNKNWTLQQFAEMYAFEGKTDYKTFLEFKKIHKLNINETIYLLGNGERSSGDYKAFRDGAFKIKDINKAGLHMKHINDFGKYYEGYKRRSFIYACVSMFETEGYSHRMMLGKMEILGGKLQDAPSTSMYLSQLENIYNYKNQKNKLRFF